jgi:hypothetical protein
MLALTAMLLAGALGAAELPQPGAEQVQAYRKILCSTNDGEASYYEWSGDVFSRVPGEKDRKLFRVAGMNVRQCGTVEDKEKGEGFRLVTREIMVYLDVQTGEVLDTWENPFTGETVEVVHVENDPVNQPPIHAIAWGGRPLALPFSSRGNHWWMTLTFPLFYENELGGPYQEYVGGMYQATEMFNYMGDIDDLVDANKTTTTVKVGWARISQWLPWMKMGDRAGHLYFHAAGVKLDNYQQMSALLREEISKNYPLYDEPPPLDDDRRNETSWTWFRKVMEARENAE